MTGPRTQKKNEVRPSYGELVAHSARSGDPFKYARAKEYITTMGRGLNKRLSKPDGELTEDERKMKDDILGAMVPSPYDFVVYRTDSAHWLEGKKPGDIVDIGVYIGGSLDKDFVIPENRGVVKQRVNIHVSRGDKMMTSNSGDEEEVDVGGAEQKLHIDSVREEDGVPVYDVTVIRG